MIKNKFSILKTGHLQPNMLILHLSMFLDQINSLMHLLFKMLTLKSNIKFKSQKIEDNKVKFLVKVLKFLINKFQNEKNIFKKEDLLLKVHHNLSLVFLLLNLLDKLNVKSFKCPKKKSF